MEGPLPRAAEALSAAVSLGSRSLRPASGILLAVALTVFVWTGLAVEFFGGLGSRNPAGASVLLLSAALLTVAGFAVLSGGFLVLIPLQDSLERGRATSEREAVRAVVRRTGSLAASGLVQAAIVSAPPAIVCVTLATQEMRAVIEEGGTLDPPTLAAIQAAVLRATLGATCFWVVATSVLFLFAAHFLLLEGRGPLRSIWLSATLFFRRGLPEWSRFLAIALFWALLYAVVALPGSEIQRAVVPLPRTSFLRTTLPAAWSAVSITAALVYGVAGLVVLFRRLVPVRP